MHEEISAISAEEAVERLINGNRKYLEASADGENILGDVSKARRADTSEHGQHPYAVVITCSDSRVIPESIFCAGIGDLFVIRVAGNVIDNHQLGSVEYALSHLGCKLVVVLGHTHCGAVDAAIHHDPDGYIKYLTDEIRKAIGDETDELAACRLNIAHSVFIIERDINIRRMKKKSGVSVRGAIYDIESGEVKFL